MGACSGRGRPIDPRLAEGRAAFERRAWREARAALSLAREAGDLEPEDLWRLGVASFLLGDEEDFVSALRDAHQASVAAEDPAHAARYAFWLGFHLINRGDAARGSGWLGRAGRHLQRTDTDCPERGYLLLPAGYRALGEGDYDGAARAASEAVAVGERFHDPDLLALALHMHGRALLRQSRVDEGLALLDEAMVSVATGELSPQVTGLIYCSVISACREVWALARAHEWTAALTDWCAGQPDMVPYTGECRVYRAEILQMHGAWQDAMEEALRASACFQRGHEPAGIGLALYQRGELHRLRGELEEAEEAYRAASRSGREPQPGLALLRLAQGDPGAATSAMRRALAETTNPLRRARLLPAYVEILLEAGGIDAARAACAELEDVSGLCAPGVLGTVVAQAQGAIDLAAGNPKGALAPLRRASREWQEADAPYEAARVRVLLGLACRALGDEDGAALELEAARMEFDRLGAVSDLARLDALTRRRTARSGPGLTPREREVLAELATGSTNRAIAEKLFISEKTVARHVANIFGKLGVSSRAAATAYAYEHDLLDRPT